MTLDLPDLITSGDLDKHQAADSQMLARQAQGKVREYCGWHVAPARTETLVVDGNGSRVLHLRSLLVTEVQRVVVDGAELAASQYDWSADGMLERRSGCWPDRFRVVQVELTHGYDPAPDGLIAVALGYAARLADSPAGRTREQVGQVGVGFAAGGPPLLQGEKDDLAPYKLNF